MRLSPGTRLGTYEILSALGAGGMGVVYRARDVRLGRDVALKVLPEDVACDRDRLQRFEQEARSASALNHPNIVTIYELGEAEGTCYIAMELVEGDTLRWMLTSGAVPLSKVVRIAAQVADGLAKAHESGIIHRDLKPENLMVSREGHVKILDFGLAKLTKPSGADSANDSLLGGAQTATGMVVGTIGYMSPEQSSGQPVDFRSDQFSLGLVLYETAAGKPAFRRDTAAETLAAILRDDPEPLGSVNRQAPAPLCWVIERCLAKEPGERYASTRDLARDLAALRERLSEAAVSPPPARPSNLPMPRTAFVSREKESAAVTELLQQPDAQLITLTGPGGIGKSRLALQVARDLADRFPGGTYLVPLAPVSDAALVPAEIVQSVGLRESAGKSPLEALRDHIQNTSRTPMLLLLDNFEHLEPAAPLIADLLAAGPSLKVLVTSRAPLHIYGEHEFPVPALEVPDMKAAPSLEKLAQCPAVALFRQRARSVKPQFEITQENAAAVATICSQLDGLPLAIELAAAQIKMLSPVAMLSRLESRMQLLTGGARDLPARQQTLRGAMDWSYGLLNPAEQKLFRRLSVFAGGCTLEAVEAVCDAQQDLGLDVYEGMASLIDKSLVKQQEQEGSEPRYVMLKTIRDYGAEHLRASGEEESTQKAHAAYCLVLAEEAAPDTESGRAAKMESLEAEHDNLRAALDQLIRTENAKWGMRIGAALFQFWETKEHFVEGRDRLGKLLRLPGASARDQQRARLSFAAGVLAENQGDYAAADTLLQESLDIARETKDDSGTMVSLNALAVFARDRGKHSAAVALFEECLAACRTMNDRVAEARALSNLASAVRMQGDLARARVLYEECSASFAGLGDRTGWAWSLDHQGDVAREQGEAETAGSLLGQSLAAFRELGDKWGIAGVMADLGNLAKQQGDHPGANSHYGESLRIFRELGSKRGIARLLECFAGSAVAQSRPDRALRLAGAAAALRQSIGAPLLAAEHAQLERELEPARAALNTSASTAAWMEGWAMPAEKAIAYALSPE